MTGEGPRYRRSYRRANALAVEPGRIDPARAGRARALAEQHGRGRCREPAQRTGLRIRGGVGSTRSTRSAPTSLDPSRLEGYVLAYRQWLPNPSETIATRLTDDAMHPILPAGSIVAVDRSITDPRKLHGQIVAARPDGVPMIRWLDLSGRHVILRPNQTSGREFPVDPRRLRRSRLRSSSSARSFGPGAGSASASANTIASTSVSCRIHGRADFEPSELWQKRARADLLARLRAPARLGQSGLGDVDRPHVRNRSSGWPVTPTLRPAPTIRPIWPRASIRPPESLAASPAGTPALIFHAGGERIWRRVEFWPFRDAARQL